jgi:mono/diheme cytochrome c family protein
VNFITQAVWIGLIIWSAWQWNTLAPAVRAASHEISYGRQIAPLFALRCAGCHGVSNPSSSLRLTQFQSLRAGGNIGDEIVPGHPDKSILMDFIEGRRGPRQRMPQNSTPLSPAEIASVRQWISEGAENDRAEGPCFDLEIARLSAARGEPIHIRARITGSGFMILTLREPRSGRDLYVEEGSIKSPREVADVTAPGEWISRTLRGERDWPSSVSVDLRIQYPSIVPTGSALIVTADRNQQSTSKLLRNSCAPL